MNDPGVVLMQTITATYEDGVLKPAQPLSLPEQTQVRITIGTLEWDATKEERMAAVQDFLRVARVHSERLTRDELHERR